LREISAPAFTQPRLGFGRGGMDGSLLAHGRPIGVFRGPLVRVTLRCERVISHTHIARKAERQRAAVEVHIRNSGTSDQ